MKRPTISQTHAICESLKARGVIVLAFSSDDVAGASYGKTKAECKQMAYTLDCLIDAINEGRIPVWTDSMWTNSMGDLAVQDFSEY